MQSTTQSIFRDGRRLLEIFLLSALLGLISCFAHPKRSQFSFYKPLVAKKDMASIEEILAWEKDTYVWLDARNQAQFDDGRIPGAIPCFLQSLDQEGTIERVFNVAAEGKKLAVYCSSDECDLSKQVANRLREDFGMTDVFVVKGGYEVWKQKGLPIER